MQPHQDPTYWQSQPQQQPPMVWSPPPAGRGMQVAILLLLILNLLLTGYIFLFVIGVERAANSVSGFFGG